MTKEESQQWIGEQLATLRKKKGVTQTELSEKCGLAQGHLARIEAGRYNVGFHTVRLIANSLGYEITFTDK